MPYTKTFLIRFSHHRFIFFLFQAEKRSKNFESHSAFFINENLTSLNYSVLGKPKAEKKRRTDHNLTNFEVIYTFQGKVFVKKSEALLIGEMKPCLNRQDEGFNRILKIFYKRCNSVFIKSYKMFEFSARP